MTRAILILLSVVALVFRAAAWRNPSAFIAIPDPLALPLSGLGVLHLACGVWAWWKRPSSLTRVFLLSGIGGCVHWGGSIAADAPGVEIAFLVFYVAATAMGDGAFLDFSLRYPRKLSRRGFPAISFYLVAIAALIAVPIAPFWGSAVVDTLLGVIIMLSFAMSIAGGVVFLVKWVRAGRAERRELFLTPIVVVLVVTSGLDLMADQGWLPGAPEAWTLWYGFVPLVFVWALMRLRTAE